MQPTQEQRALIKSIRQFAKRECGTREQREKWLDPGEDLYSSELYQKIAELGWVGVAIPEEYGGSGGSYVDQAVVFEEVYRGLLPVGAIGPSNTVAGCYRRFGSERQKQEVLGAIAQGRVVSISISEPEAGSDVANIATTAERADGGFVVNGQKTWCSYAHVADRILLVARTSREEKRHAGLTLLDIPTTFDGIRINPIPTMAGKEVNEVLFTDCFVPEENVVGELGRGFPQIMAGLDGERVLGAAVGIGLAQRVLDDLLPYLKGRTQFGQPIGNFQALRHRVADHLVELECARLLTYEAAESLADGADAKTATRLSAMAKLKASEVAKALALDGLQMMGGNGYSTANDMEHHVRHALVLPIYAGASEIQRDIISRGAGLG